MKSNEIRKIAKWLVAYPEILKQIPQGTKNSISKTYGISDNSKQIEINKADANKKQYGEKLLVYVDEKGKVMGTGYGTNLWTFGLGRKERANRKQLIEWSDKIYYITEDPEVKEKTQERYKSIYDNPEAKAVRDRMEKFIKIKRPKLEEKMDEKIKELENAFHNGMDVLKSEALKGNLFSSSDVLKKLNLDKALKDIGIIGHELWATNSYYPSYTKNVDDVNSAVKAINNALSI